MTEPNRVLTADPPWPFADKLPGNTRGAASNYRVLTVPEICAFELPDVAEDALLFLWRVSSMQEEALRVCRAWGFVPKAEIVWVKTRNAGVQDGLAFGMGRYVRAAHETCLIGRRGRAKVRLRNVRSVFFAPRGAHSAKPEAFYDLVEQLAEGPYVELFARRQRPNWTCLGLESNVLR